MAKNLKKIYNIIEWKIKDKGFDKMIKKNIKYIKYIILLLLVLLVLYIIIDNMRIVTRTYEIENKKIGRDFDRYKIVQLSDFHNKSFGKESKRLVDKIKRINPDIIVITGDFIDSRTPDIELGLNLINSLKDYPIYYIAGNHESRIGDYNLFEENLKSLGVNILNDSYRIIEKGSSKINLVGVLDPAFKGKKSAMTKLEKNLKEVENLYTICLSHRPELFPYYKSYGIDLSLTGHTHGGQIRFPIIGGIIAPNQGLLPDYIAGLYEEEGSNMIVSSGLGNSLIPFRLFNPSEIGLIELKTK